MPSITLRNVPASLYQRLKASAQRNRRSLNQEAIVALEHYLDMRPLDADEFLTLVRERRKRLSRAHLTDDDLRNARDQGRS